MEGLPDGALRRPVLPSGWSCPGVAKHLTVSDGSGRAHRRHRVPGYPDAGAGAVLV
jgi:hypothetical protein